MIKSVYNIILLENSPAIFKKFPNDHIHRFSQRSDTGLELNLLQHHIFIPLDIFLKNLYDNGIHNKLDAWLAFLGSDDPEVILKLIRGFPEFKPIYEHIYSVCLNTENTMGYFSKELQILDRNTVKYMIDQQQEELDKLQEELDKTQEELDKVHEKLYKAHEELDKVHEKLDKAHEELDKVQLDRDSLQQDRDNLQQNRDSLQQDRDNLKQDRDNLKQDRDKLQSENNILRKEYSHSMEQLEKYIAIYGRLSED